MRCTTMVRIDMCKFLVLLLALLFFGCAAPAGVELPPLATFEPDDWTDAEIRQIYQSADDWERFAGRRVYDVEPVGWGQKPFIRHPADLGWNQEGALQGPVEGNGNVFRVNIAADIPPEDFAFVIRHEMGHALKLGHVPAGIMQAGVDPNAAWTDDDRAECIRVGVCL